MQVRHDSTVWSRDVESPDDGDPVVIDATKVRNISNHLDGSATLEVTVHIGFDGDCAVTCCGHDECADILTKKSHPAAFHIDPADRLTIDQVPADDEPAETTIEAHGSHKLICHVPIAHPPERSQAVIDAIVGTFDLDRPSGGKTEYVFNVEPEQSVGGIQQTPFDFEDLLKAIDEEKITDVVDTDSETTISVEHDGYTYRIDFEGGVVIEEATVDQHDDALESLEDYLSDVAASSLPEIRVAGQAGNVGQQNDGDTSSSSDSDEYSMFM